MNALTERTDSVVVGLLSDLVKTGVRLAPDGENLRCSSPVPLELEAKCLIARHKVAILAALSVWSKPRALALEQEADALIERLGVSGTDPVIGTAASRAVAAGAAQDMAALRLAVFEMEARAHKLAAKEAGRPT